MEWQYGDSFTETVTETDTDEWKRKVGNQALVLT